MQYLFAPMEGLTDAVCRAAHRRFWPGAGRADRYYAPFVSPTKDHIVDPRRLRDILPENEHNCGVPLVPQVLCKNAGDFLWMAGELAAMGYREVNLNLGCPSGTVVAKGKGAGFLRTPVLLDHFFEQVFAAAPPIAISVKTRLGIADPEEFGPLLEIFDRYPIAELIIHPRVQKDLYKNEPRMEVFGRALASTRLPVCYNGSLNTAGQIAAFARAYPAVQTVMLGRGLIANPGLVRQARTGVPTDRATLRAYMDALYEGYAAAFGSRKNAVRRMKGFWNYTLCLFDGHEALEKRLRRADEPWEYEAVVGQIFAQLPLRQDAAGVK